MAGSVLLVTPSSQSDLYRGRLALKSSLSPLNHCTPLRRSTFPPSGSSTAAATELKPPLSTSANELYGGQGLLSPAYTKMILLKTVHSPYGTEAVLPRYQDSILGGLTS